MSDEAQATQGNTEEGGSTPPEGANVPPEGNETPPEGVNTPPEGEGATPKGGDETPPEDVVPESYDLKVDEDGFLGQEDVERIATNAKELGLTNGEAQELFDMENDAVNRFMDGQQKLVEDAHAEWLETAEADKEIGGENLSKNVALGNRVIEAFGSDELKELLDASKYGDHPEVRRIFARIGKAMGEDALVKAGGHNAGNKTMEETFYGGD